VALPWLEKKNELQSIRSMGERDADAKIARKIAPLNENN
jgi:hypothetical protein